jgi:hypothetical protein
MNRFRRSHAPIAAAFAALAALLILPAVHGAQAAHHRYARIALVGNPDAPQSLSSSTPGESRDAARPCPLCLAISHARAGTADDGGIACLEAPFSGARLVRLPAQPAPFQDALAPLSPRAPPTLS